MSTEPRQQRIAAQASHLTKIYGRGEGAVVAVNDVSVQFLLGSFTAIMGPSGSGKSTLMHLLAGLDQASNGRVVLAGADLTALPDRELTRLRRDHVGFIFQSFNLLPTLTAEQNILLPLELAGRKPDNDFFGHLVHSLDLQDRLTHRPSELSGGQQQRVAIARAMIPRPDVIFADEPTGALDTKSGSQLLGYLQTCSSELGQTIIMVTHDPRAAAYASRALILVDGRIESDIANPTTDLVTQTLGALV